MRYLTLTFYSDPSHGWLEVPLWRVEQFGVKVSSFSYVHGNRAFLEEDCDAPAFLKAAHERGYLVNTRQLHADEPSHVRSYSRFGGHE